MFSLCVLLFNHNRFFPDEYYKTASLLLFTFTGQCDLEPLFILIYIVEHLLHVLFGTLLRRNDSGREILKGRIKWTPSRDRFIKQVNKKMRKIYSKKEGGKETDTYATLIEDAVYGKSSHVLICYSPDIAMNKSKKSLDDKYSKLASLIKKHNLKRAIEPIKQNDGELSARRNRYGFFGVFTNYKELSDREPIMTTKSKPSEKLEKIFRILKIKVPQFDIKEILMSTG